MKQKLLSVIIIISINKEKGEKIGMNPYLKTRGLPTHQ